MIRVIKGSDFFKVDFEVERKKWEYKVEEELKNIMQEVLMYGDNALISLTKKFDNIDLSEKGFIYSLENIKADTLSIEDEVKYSINVMIKRVSEFHERERINSWFFTNDKNSLLGQIIKPVEKVLIYVPGGRAVYPSTIIMTTIPALIAGVKEIYITTPPQQTYNELFLYTLKVLNFSKFYTLGGAQAIFAFSYGTESIPRVDMIVGPGNIYVALAKKMVFGEVGIDGINGPSEIAILIDKEKEIDIKKVVCDFLAQIEHSPYDRGWIITENEEIVDDIVKEINIEIEKAMRSAILKESMKNSFIILVEDKKNAIEIINHIAPEHLEILSNNYMEYIPHINNAGAIFINHSSIFGDFIAGPSHVLPTGRRAIFSSGLSVNTFIKRISFVNLSDEDIREISKYGSIIAREEGFFMHEKSLKNYFGGKS
ncbi:MAG: histidinol dehydrogenase [Dictyoglomus sp. NZ13-RE01]|nr:MAG: histidinol dehydrogenase [Dictyoglomus sp. NZ13-RE01]